MTEHAAGALLLDAHDRILLVEPTYKDFWEIPGGRIDQGETPSQACARELHEELGLRRETGRLLVVDWAPDPTRVLFVFDGGRLDTQEVADLRLPADELASYEFLPLEAALTRLIPRLSRRVAAAFQARTTGKTLYLEHGLAR